jgi:hypothetical protein
VTWRKGQSGNPKGRPPGVGEVARLRAAISQCLPEVLGRLVQQAREGDTQAARLLLERVLPPVKAVALAEPLPLPATGSLAERAEAVLAAMVKGETAPDAAEAAMAGLMAVARLRTIDDLERRIAALEQRGHTDDRKLEAADRGA